MQMDKRSLERRNIVHTRKDWARVEECLTNVEKADGIAKAWALRERLERGNVTLEQLTPRWY
jgi:hypothetical protein